MKVKELIERLQKLNCDEKEVVDWRENFHKYKSNCHSDYAEIDIGLTLIPIGICIDNFATATSDVYIRVKLEREENIK